MQRFNLAAWAINHRSLVAFAMMIIVLAGAWSYVRIGRSEDPPFTVKDMVVQASWPGATISDTLQQVTERIERKLQELATVDHIRSYTIPGRSTVVVRLKGTVSSKSVPEQWYQVRKKIDDIRLSLPQGVIGPEFNDEFGDTYSVIYSLSSDGFSHRELRDYSETVRSRLLRVSDVKKVDLVGALDERIYLEISNQRLASLGVDSGDVIRALRAQNAVTPAGLVRTPAENIQLQVSGSFTSENDLRSMNFVSGGRMFRLSDIGTLTRTYSDPPQPRFRINGQEAIALGVVMRDGGNVIELGAHLNRAMKQITGDLPIGVEPRIVADQPAVVAHSVGEFLRSLLEALTIVIGISLLSLGLRAGAVVALSIPLVLCAVFIVLDYLEIDLHRVSLGALIISLGLLVDDAMITVEMMVRKLEEGWDKVRAATHAYMTTHFPMGTGTLVTVAAFLPIGLAQSDAGEYLYTLFAVVAIALIISWFVAAIFTPLIGYWVLPDKWKQGEQKIEGRVTQSFRRALGTTMRWPRTTVALALIGFGVALFALPLVPRQYFPGSDRPELFVDLKLPLNSSYEATEKAASELDRLLNNDPDISHWSTYVGRGAIRFYLPMQVQLQNNFFSQVVIVAKSLDARNRVHAKVERELQTSLPQAVVRVAPLEMGAPVGWPVQYRVSGADPDRVRDIALSLASTMGRNPQLRNINFDWIESAKTLQIKVDQDQAKLLNLSSEALAQVLNTLVSGTVVTQVRDNIHLIDVVMRAVEDERLSLRGLQTLQIPLPDGNSVPLMQIASVGYGQDFPLIRRRDRVPTLTVQSDLAPGLHAETAVASMRDDIQALEQKLPPGYRIDLGGVAEESAKAQKSLMVVLPVIAILLLSVVMVQLHSFSLMLLVLSIAPLGFSGVVAALLLSGKPLGFVAIVGVIALVGMDVRNSVVLMVQIDAEIAEGRSPWEAVVEATVHRFRPILLTASAAALGMIPIASTVFWGPFAFAVIGGLAVATVLTLLFLPALYVLWFRVGEPRSADCPNAMPAPSVAS